MFFSGVVFFLSCRLFLRLSFALLRFMSNIFGTFFILLSAFQPKQLFLPVVGWYSCLVSDSLLSSKLAIDQPVD